MKNEKQKINFNTLTKMKTSTVKHIDNNGVFTNSYGQFQKYQVTMADGIRYGFLSKADFPKKVGDEIQFEVTNAEYNTAKLVKPQQEFKKDRSTNESILRQVAFKGAIELAGKGVIKLDEIEKFTNDFNTLLS
jgi:hypothetical protein